MYLKLTPSSLCMKVAIAVFLEWSEKKNLKKSCHPLMTINECKGRSRNRASIDDASLKYSLHLFSAQRFS